MTTFDLQQWLWSNNGVIVPEDTTAYVARLTGPDADYVLAREFLSIENSRRDNRDDGNVGKHVPDSKIQSGACYEVRWDDDGRQRQYYHVRAVERGRNNRITRLVAVEVADADAVLDVLDGGDG